jgi:transcriptional regulator with XRE-family HTH domain
MRLRAALSQADLAEQAGVQRTTVIRIERGGEANVSTMRKLSRALGVKPAELIGPNDID